MFRYLQPGEKGDFWGSAQLLNKLTSILKGWHLPEDVTVENIEFFLEEIYNSTLKSATPRPEITFKPSSIRFVGPEGTDGQYDAFRISINYDINRIIQSISLS